MSAPMIFAGFTCGLVAGYFGSPWQMSVIQGLIIGACFAWRDLQKD